MENKTERNVTTTTTMAKTGPVDIGIDRKTRLIVVKQGEQTIRLTKDQVSVLNRLRKGEMPNDGYITTTLPRTRFKVMNDDMISMCSDDGSEKNLIILKRTRKYDDLERITAFMEANRPRIAWSRDFKKRF